MKIVIDGFEDILIPDGNETLGELLAQIEEWIRENKRIIIQTRLEGKTLSEKDKKTLFNKKVSEFKILELTTANPWSWAIDSLKEAKVKLPNVASEMEKVSLLIQKGNYADAFLLLDKCIQTWDKINETLRQIEKLFALDYAKIYLEGERIPDKMEEFAKLLEEANRAIEQNDLLNLADILEYEIAPRIREEKRMVNEIAKMITQQMN